MRNTTFYHLLILSMGMLLFPTSGHCLSTDILDEAGTLPSETKTGISDNNILVIQKEIRIAEKQTEFELDITANRRLDFSFPKWITPLDIKYKKGKKTYRFAAKEMEEAGERIGKLTIKSKRGKELVTIPVQQSLDLNLQERLAPVPKQAVFEEDGYFVWGASCIKGDDNMYHLFYSRWKKEYGFFAWASHSEIAHAVSKSLMGPYQFKNVALPARGKQYWDGTTTHNPTVHKFGNKYYLYYMGNCGDGKVAPNRQLNWSHRNTQRIGVAFTSDLNKEWIRQDQPLIDISPEQDAPDHLMTSNPSATQMPDGRFLIVYKAVGVKRPLPFGGPVVHLAATSESPTGPFVKHDKQIFTSGDDVFPAEDPFIWTAGNKMYAIVKDNKGNFTHIGRSLALFESKDGINWHPSKHQTVSGLHVLWENGVDQKVSSLERPQLYVEDGIIKALFAAVSPHGDFSETFNVHIPIIPVKDRGMKDRK